MVWCCISPCELSVFLRALQFCIRPLVAEFNMCLAAEIGSGCQSGQPISPRMRATLPRIGNGCRSRHRTRSPMRHCGVMRVDIGFLADWTHGPVHENLARHERKRNTMAASSRLMITEAERRFPVRIRIAVPVGGFGERLNQMQSWLDQNAGADGWTMTPSGIRGRGQRCGRRPPRRCGDCQRLRGTLVPGAE